MSETRYSKIACQACRSRKVRCCRELPQCQNCQNCGQPCSYPSGMLKPGPKPGSIHKRRRLESRPQGSAPHEPREEQYHIASPIPRAAISEKELLLQSKHIQSISFLITQSHESPESVRATTPPTNIEPRQCHLIDAYHALGVAPDCVKQMVETFFRTFTSFRLFREPQFFTKLLQISSGSQLKGLLAAILAFAGKIVDEKAATTQEQVSGSDFADLAIFHVDNAIAECGDDPPPLCLLQALILTTHWLIIKGVRGRAWRYLGLCIRIVFELGLHSVDAGKGPESFASAPKQWCEDEEKRRAYWAVWEMDQFANILKKVPMITNWTQNQVFLPAEDERWFRNQPQRSCFLETDLISRPKSLQASESNSSKAWYIVLNSMVAEAYTLALTTSRTDPPSNKSGFTLVGGIQSARSFPNSFSTLLNSIQLCLIVLPSSLRFYGQHLDFGTRTFDQNPIPSALHLQSSIYHIAMMPEVAKLLALRTYVIEAYVQRVRNMVGKHTAHDAPQNRSTLYTGSAREIEQCFNASDTIFNLVINCNENHCQYVNPYIAHAPWLAATVQLLRQELTEDESEKKLINSKFEILKAIHDRFINHWGMSTVPKQNLDDLAVRLGQFTALWRGLAQEERTANTRPKSPAQVAHLSRNDNDTRTYGDKCWQSKSTTQYKNVEWSPNLTSGMDSQTSPPSNTNSNISQSTNQNVHQAQYPYQPHLATKTISSDMTIQQPYPVPPAGLDDADLSLFCHAQKLPEPSSGSISGLDQDSWNEAGYGQGQAIGLSSTLDWFSTYAEASGELSNYLDEVFSGPYIG